MAVLKFKNKGGEWVTLTNYTVNPIEPVQTTGSSTKDVMSQNAVTIELDKKADKTVASSTENGLMSSSMFTDLEVAKNGIYSLPDYIVGNSDDNVFTYSNGAMGAYLNYKLKRKSVEGDYTQREVVIPWATDMDGGVFTTGYTENGRNFAVKMSSGKAYVTVPKDWYYVYIELDSEIPESGEVTATINQENSDLTTFQDLAFVIHLSSVEILAKYNSSNYKLIPIKLQDDTGSGPTTGIAFLYYNEDTNKLYLLQLPGDASSTSTTFTVKAVNDYSLPIANSTTLGGVKSSITGTTPDRDYSVEVNSDGTMKVNVPWTDTTYSVATTSTNGLMSSTDKTNLDTLVSRQLIGEFTYNIQASQVSSDYKFVMDKDNSWVIANSGLTMNDSGTSATDPVTQSQVIVIGTYTLSRGFLSVETMIGMTNEDFVAVSSIDLLGKSIKITVSGLTPNSEKEFGKLKVKIYK